ncbi:MAG: NAD+ synthase [Deltaproteobacteria bacterium RIFCSPLOWO2_12_FULL_44_12]|nr:MAG: NAD+ synthase [Deltaproteobacteria bacterium RIFCSPHIGHO2_01_FULL_43_49]OGQ16456.1 MAG: NAD+ synthase [Deltaproteobacteria bacterium RIFCSPHIGHO2_02_FULL_44_53]OGQ27716.1 MAG: NAD+ synthase [Deltaproteobacteria bacterium RIFCSPHIGHO2_12_FULL_44_21]OGQ32974.1 MAG: NAD+ synthase [Deltaproteobacteria bacterium RIFCSPLOWO2_01_FULL_45_74]OGQ42076.1 MAG: NAD+ synthase [Deltaproteobacteria bacterium RIFCSPLOWO2_02_FULL_44_34]OGQ71454.1 MAG: NAD+ synthase [Deltaproteobacteria bacterium RIFCSPL
MKIAIYQINTTVGNFKGNESKILKGIDLAKRKEASLAIFPEMATFGYPPRDLLDKPYLVDANIAVANRIAKQTTKDFGCIFGFIARNENKIGRGLFNAAALAFDGKIQNVQPKTLLPTYDVFDEARHFDPATTHHPITVQGLSIGLMVCEDLWSDYEFGGRKHYDFDPAKVLKNAGAQLLVNISASPFHVGKRETRRQLIAEAAKQNQLPVIYCNLVGGNDELVFDGQSLVANAKGEIVFEGKRFEEELAFIDLESLKPVAKLDSPSDIEEIHDALVLGLKDYVAKCHFSKAVIGLSGGIDSAVVGVLAVRALGAKNVLGVSLPSAYSSVSSLKDAKELAKNLKIDYRVIPIHNIYLDYLKTLKIDIRRGVPLAAENIQARIRGNLLMAISNQTNALVLSTGNKSELACGYCTLYGDLAGGLALLSDVPKMTVYELARFLNKKKKLIPENILKKPPSAELRPNQKDEDSLPPYKVLDPILKAYIEDHLSVGEIVKLGFSKKIVEEVIWRVDHNEYKRRQAPPGIKITSKAFGIGRRFPIAWEYR